jgi:hypothetical protein
MNDCGGIRLRKAKKCEWGDDVVGIGSEGGDGNRDDEDDNVNVEEYDLLRAADLSNFQPEL